MALSSSVKIEIDNKEIDDLLSFSIDQKMHSIQEFQVTCRKETFEEPDGFLMEKSKKMIGSIISIFTEEYEVGGEDSTSGMFFKGIIHSINAVRSYETNEDHIVLSGFSPDVLLNDHAGCCSFENKTLKQIIGEVLKPYPRDVLKNSVDPEYKEQIPYCVQYNENRWEFLQRLAARYGEWMYYDGSELRFGLQDADEFVMTLGWDLHSLDYSLNLKAPDFKYVSYDYLNAKKVEASTNNSGKDQQNEIGKYAFDQSGKKYSQPAILEYPHLNIDSDDFGKAQKNALELEASSISLGMTNLTGTSENMLLVPGSKISVKAPKTEGSGQVDYGDYIITEIHHNCDNLLNYRNKFSAVPAEAKIPGYANPDAVPMSESQSAIVTDNNDPENLGRVRVQFRWQDSKNKSPWIRVVNPYAGNEQGFYFIPEIDDEVLIGFEAGDVERPYVIGSLYHGKHKPPSDFPDKDNSFKGIVTRSKLKIVFDDKKKETTIDTPGGNRAVLSDDGKSILLEDQNENKVELNSKGIVMDSPKDIKISSKSKITIEGKGGVDISSNSDAKISGLNVDLDAKASVKAKGNASAELSASGNTTVKGAMVMIN